MIKYIEDEFECKTCYSTNTQIGSLLPKLRSSHLNPSCNVIKKTYRNIRACRYFENMLAVEWGKKHKEAFAKICPYGVVEIAAPIYYKRYFGGILFAGEFSLTGKLPENILTIDQKKKCNISELNGIRPPELSNERYTKLVSLLEMSAMALAVHASDNLNAQSVQIGEKEFIRNFINGNFRAQIGLGDIARRMGWQSEEYTSRQIKKLFGKGFNKILTDTRLDNAKWLLAESTYRICDVALWSGFSDPLYFCRVFRKHFNCTPREFRLTYTRKKQ